MDTVYTIIEVGAAIVFLLDFFGVFRFLRHRLLPRFRAVSDVPRARFFNLGRSLFLGGAVLTLVLGFVSQPARIAIAGAVFLVVITKEVIDWRRDVAVLRETKPQEIRPQEIELQPAIATSSATLDLTTPEVFSSERDGDDDRDKASDDLPPPKRSQVIVMRDAVELRVMAGSVFVIGPVTCEVTHPSGTTYRATAQPEPIKRPYSLLLSALAPRWAILQYPTEFDHAPRTLAMGIYRVRWEIPPHSAFGLFPSVVHDAFRIGPTP